MGCQQIINMEDKQRDAASGVKMCPTQSLWWTITGRHWIESKNQCYQCDFHAADSVSINTLSFSLKWHTVTDWNIFIFGSGNIPEIHCLFQSHLRFIETNRCLMLTVVERKPRTWNTKVLSIAMDLDPICILCLNETYSQVFQLFSSHKKIAPSFSRLTCVVSKVRPLVVEMKPAFCIHCTYWMDHSLLLSEGCQM